MRDLYVSIDGDDDVTLLYGESFETELEPGEHWIKATNRVFTRKLSFQVQSGETATFSVGNVTSWGFLSLLMMISGTVPYKVWIEQRKG